MNLRANTNKNAASGDLDALKQISELNADPAMRDFLTVIFNYELNQGEDALFKYMEAYRKTVEGVVAKLAGEEK